MADVKQQLVLRKVQHAVQGHRQLHNAEVRRQMAAGLGIAAAGWAVKRIWETIVERKEEEEERIERHKDEVFSTWLNCKPIGGENVRFK